MDFHIWYPADYSFCAGFASKFFSVLTNVLGVKHVFTSAYRPTTNGQVERWNATLADTVAHLSGEADWDLTLGLACTAYNSSVHSTTGFSPFELASTRDPCPAVWSRTPDLTPRSREQKLQFRHGLLARAARLRRAAQETMEKRLQRYKLRYDDLVRRRAAGIQVGDSVLVRTHVLEPGRSPKLSFPVAGPYPVIELSGVNVQIRTREGLQTLHLDRVIRCPMDLPSGVEWSKPRVQKPPIVRPRQERDDEYVIDRLVSHARAEDDSCWLVRVRWAAFGPDDDTWEPAASIPETFLRLYERRKKLSPGVLTLPEAPAIHPSQV
jgi:hypothetical protein